MSCSASSVVRRRDVRCRGGQGALKVRFSSGHPLNEVEANRASAAGASAGQTPVHRYRRRRPGTINAISGTFPSRRRRLDRFYPLLYDNIGQAEVCLFCESHCPPSPRRSSCCWATLRHSKANPSTSLEPFSDIPSAGARDGAQERIFPRSRFSPAQRGPKPLPYKTWTKPA